MKFNFCISSTLLLAALIWDISLAQMMTRGSIGGISRNDDVFDVMKTQPRGGRGRQGRRELQSSKGKGKGKGSSLDNDNGTDEILSLSQIIKDALQEREEELATTPLNLDEETDVMTRMELNNDATLNTTVFNELLETKGVFLNFFLKPGRIANLTDTICDRIENVDLPDLMGIIDTFSSKLDTFGGGVRMEAIDFYNEFRRGFDETPFAAIADLADDVRDTFMRASMPIKDAFKDVVDFLEDRVDDVIGFADNILTGFENLPSILGNICECFVLISRVLIAGSCGLGIDSVILFLKLVIKFVERGIKEPVIYLNNSIENVECDELFYVSDVLDIYSGGTFGTAVTVARFACATFTLGVEFAAENIDLIIDLILLPLEELLLLAEFYQQDVCPVLIGVETALGNPTPTPVEIVN